MWAIHIGITCGCQLYEVAIVTSLLATIVLIILNRISIGMKSHILVIHCQSADAETDIINLLKSRTKKYRVKSRNHTEKGMDFVFEITTKECSLLAGELEKQTAVERFSLMEYDSDDIL